MKNRNDLLIEFLDKSCHHLGIDIEVLKSSIRDGKTVKKRQILIYALCKHFTELGLSEIGKCVNRDHSTVMYSRDIINDTFDFYVKRNYKAKDYDYFRLEVDHLEIIYNNIVESVKEPEQTFFEVY